MESGQIRQHLASECAVYPLPLSYGAPGDGKAREAPQQPAPESNSSAACLLVSTSCFTLKSTRIRKPPFLVSEKWGGNSKMKRVSSCLAGGEGLLGSELLQFCQNAAHEHAVGEGEAVTRARRRQRVVDEEATALGIANRIQAIDDLVLGVDHFEINGGFKAA